MSNLRFTRTHEWVRQEPDHSLAVGMTEHALTTLGELVSLHLPLAGQEFRAGDEVAIAESAKVAVGIVAPLDGVILAINQVAGDAPTRLNNDPLEEWVFKILPRNPHDFDALLSADAYRQFITTI